MNFGYVGKCRICNFFFLGNTKREVIRELSRHFQITKQRRRKHRDIIGFPVDILRVDESVLKEMKVFERKNPRVFYKGLRNPSK